MPVELADDATHEQIEEAVDQIFADRAGEEDAPSDSERVASDSDDPVTQRDTPDGDDEPAGEDTGADSEGDEDDSSWLTDDLRSEAAAVGIDRKDLEEFASREEFDRALRILNRQIDAARDEKGGKGKKEPEASSESETETDGKYEVALSKDVYDDEIVDEFTRMREHYDARLAALEERFQSADAAAEEERFDRGVDELQFSELFGKTGEETGVQMSRREELFKLVQIEQDVLKRAGRNVTDYNALIQRVARAEFPEEYEKRTIKNHTRKISRQSDKRQGGSATRATGEPQPTLMEEMEQLYKELEQGG